MFPQLHRAFTVDRSLFFFTGVIIFSNLYGYNSVVSMNDEGEADFLMTPLRSNSTNMFMKTDVAEQGRVWRDFPHAIK